MWIQNQKRTLRSSGTFAIISDVGSKRNNNRWLTDVFAETTIRGLPDSDNGKRYFVRASNLEQTFVQFIAQQDKVQGFDEKHGRPTSPIGPCFQIMEANMSALGIQKPKKKRIFKQLLPASLDSTS